MTMNLDNIDLERDAVPAPAGDKAVATVTTLVAEWDSAKAEIAELTRRLAGHAARVTALEQQDLPMAMEQAGLTSFKTSTGRQVDIKIVARANIPALSTIEKAKGLDRQLLQDRRTAAYAYLSEKFPCLIKTELSLSLGKGEAEMALRIAKLIRDEFQLSVDVAETVHPASLNSHFQELLEEGRISEVPTEPFSLYTGPHAKVK